VKRTILAFAALAACAAAQAAEIKVLSSNALKPVLEDLVPQFEKATGHRVRAEFAPAADLKARIEKREAFDVAILTTPLMDELAKNSHIASGSRFDVARSGAGGVFAAAGGASAREPAAALEFLRYLKAPEAVKVIRAKGMDPG
jgi:molybdate transport system substrate-binding protein